MNPSDTCAQCGGTITPTGCYCGVIHRLGAAEQQKKSALESFRNTAIAEHEKKVGNKVPILAGCHGARNGGCYCTGACRRIIGYRDVHPLENFGRTETLGLSAKNILSPHNNPPPGAL